jgi:heme exporter protein C
MTHHHLSRNALLAASAAFLALTLWMVFIWVPTETNQGAIQRALYVHVPIAWVAMVAIVAVAIFSVLYLITGRERWDRLGAATAETGVVFGALMLITGLVWARPVWGVWWTGEAKLTTALILFFVYVAYLMFRAYFPPGAQRRRLAAVIALIGAVDAPIIYWAANLWAEAHPPLIVGPARDADSALSADIGLTLLVGVIAFTLLFVVIVIERNRIRRAEDEVEALRRTLQAAGAVAQ